MFKAIRNLGAIACVVLLVGCSSSPKLLNYGNGYYQMNGEAEFGYADMVNDMQQEAIDTCVEQGKQVKILDDYRGRGGVGFAGTKRLYKLQFQCL